MMKFYESGKIPPTPHMYFVYGDGGTGKTSLFKDFLERNCCLALICRQMF